MLNSIKSFLKTFVIRFKLRKVVFEGTCHDMHIGRYSLFETDKSSKIIFGNSVVINDFNKILVKDNATVRLGDKVYVGDYATIRATRADIEIGDYSMISQSVKLISTNHEFKDKDKLIYLQDIDYNKKGIVIGQDCWIGAGAIVLPGVKIGRGVVVGANSVVTKNLPDYSVAVGNPARVISFREAV